MFLVPGLVSLSSGSPEPRATIYSRDESDETSFSFPTNKGHGNWKHFVKHHLLPTSLSRFPIRLSPRDYFLVRTETANIYFISQLPVRMNQFPKEYRTCVILFTFCVCECRLSVGLFLLQSGVLYKLFASYAKQFRLSDLVSSQQFPKVSRISTSKECLVDQARTS